MKASTLKTQAGGHKNSNIKLVNPDSHKEYPVLDEKTGKHIKYKTILMDPPWNIGQKGTLGAEQHYDLMSLAEIKDLPIPDLLEENAHVYMWVTNAVLPHAFDLLDAWGLTYRSIFTWVKPRLGLGVYMRNSTEQLLLATRGKAPVKFHGQMNWGFMPLQDHSHKPEEVYEIIERLSDGPYLEMFARQRHPGWHVWGLEAPGNDVYIPGQPVPNYTFDVSKVMKESDDE